MNNKTIFTIFVLALAIFATGCSTSPTQMSSVEFEERVASQEVNQFESLDELKEYLSVNQQAGFRGGVMFKSAVADFAPVAEAASLSYDSGTGSDYSQTNIQIKGVDEADFIKNDDRYIYVLADNKLVIIDSTSNEIISETKIDIKENDYVRDLLLNKNQILVIADSYDPSLYFSDYDIMPIESTTQNTKIFQYNIENKEQPLLDQTYDISGRYFESRMIDSVVYLISQEDLYNYRTYNGPIIKYADTVVSPKMYYFDNHEDSYQMNTVTSINIDSKEVVDSESFMLGYGSTLMVSENNIYLAYQKQQIWCWSFRCPAQETNNKERFMKAILPLLEGELKEEITSVLDEKLSSEKEWAKISAKLQKFYLELKENKEMQEQYEEMFENIEESVAKYDLEKSREYDKTIIHKINIDNGDISYDTKGEVDGRLHNQFSLDEKDGYLRVATSVNLWLSSGQIMHNNIYVLDGSLEVVGKLEGLAENESIYSTRFMGDKLFMVTFRQIDPFFVIDLSNVNEPKVLGYLKIPGYNSYLHPINETHIIGVGKETGENEWGGVSTKGVKISLFDVTNFENPVEVDKYEIGIEGTDSPILYDHKAFLYSATKNILVIPVTEIVSKQGKDYNYKYSLWNGAYVFKIDEGFKLFGKIKHSSSSTQYYSWFNEASVRRSLYIENTLYTISDKYVKANDLDNKLDEIETIELPYTENSPNYYLR